MSLKPCFGNFIKKITGAKISEAKTKRHKVREMGSITPDNFCEAIKEPAIKNVANTTKKCAFICEVKKIL